MNHPTLNRIICNTDFLDGTAFNRQIIFVVAAEQARRSQAICAKLGHPAKPFSAFFARELGEVWKEARYLREIQS